MAKPLKSHGTNCEECGEPIDFIRSSTPRRFCSMSCRSRNQYRDRPVQKPRRGQDVACPVCGKLKYKAPAEIKRGSQYCSSKCFGAANVKEAIRKSCPVCGKELVLKPSRGMQVHCSKACEAAADIKRPLDRSHNGRPAKKDKSGYVMIWEPSHPNKSFHGWQYEHRIIVEAEIGRRLERWEHVHHVNGIKDDNRPENLVVMSDVDHAALTVREIRERRAAEKGELERYRALFGPLPPDPKTIKKKDKPNA